MIEAAKGDGVEGQPGQGGAPEAQQDLPVDAGEEGADIELAVPAMPWLAHEMLQPGNGGVGALALTVGKGVVVEAFIEPGFDMAHQPLLDQTVGIDSSGQRSPAAWDR